MTEKIVRHIVIALLLIASALLLSGVTTASAPYESEISEIKITYMNGSAIAIECRHGKCFVLIDLQRKRYVFDSDDLEGEPEISFTGRPILFSEANLSHQFGFEIELRCDQLFYPKIEGASCFANYSVQRGKVDGIHRFIRIRSGGTITKYPPWELEGPSMDGGG